MDPKAYEQLCDIVYAQSGIRIREGKESMMASRIASRLKALQLEDERAYVAHLQSALPQEVGHLLDAVSTNVTSFFRESAHFDIVRDTVGEWIRTGQSKLRCWSAAASTGEEPYTLAMVLREACRAEGASPDIKILGTDINSQVLHKAKAGTYRTDLLDRIPAELRRAHFTDAPTAGPGMMRVKPALSAMMTFRRLNLAKPPFPMRGPMDIIFCRNVMIYFDDPVRDRLINEFHRLLRPGGYLFLGHSEGIRELQGRFTTVASSAYQKVGD